MPQAPEWLGEVFAEADEFTAHHDINEMSTQGLIDSPGRPYVDEALEVLASAGHDEPSWVEISMVGNRLRAEANTEGASA
jgi:hypothetical protein